MTFTVTANGDGNHYHGWATPPVSADPGYIITKIEFTGRDNIWNKPGDPCAFVYVDPESMKPQNRGGSARITGTNNSWPCKVTFTAWEEKQTSVSVPLAPLPVAFGADETKPVKVMADAVSVLLSLTAVDGKKYTIPLVPPGGLATDVVVCTSRTDIGSGYAQYVCRAKDVDYY
jgi:hypothetical protein